MLTLKEMITAALSNAYTALNVGDITQLIIDTNPEKFQQKCEQKGGNAKEARLQLYREIYQTVISYEDTFYRDKTVRPAMIGLIDIEEDKVSIEVEDEDFESDSGLVYVLGTQTFTKDGRELLKIGFTTTPMEIRIKALYKTGVPFEFTVVRKYETQNYAELEKAMHKLLTRFRINPAREFFVDDCLPFADEIYSLHQKIESI